MTRAAAGIGADACFISCTAIRSAGLIAQLEDELGIPVITSNQVMAWHMLRRCGISDSVPGFGRLMRLGGRLEGLCPSKPPHQRPKAFGNHHLALGLAGRIGASTQY